jgi:hypothetical protein
VVLAYAAVYTAIVLVWPFEPDRFLWMLAPVAFAAFAAGAGAIVRAVRAWPRQQAITGASAGAAIAVMIGVGVVPGYFSAYRTRPWENGLRDRARKGQAASRLVDALPAGARIATDFDELVSLRTGRVVVPARGLTAADYVQAPSDSASALRLDSVLTTFRITHVVVADAATLRAVQWLRARGASMAPVTTDSAGAVVFVRAPAIHASAATEAAAPSPIGK